MKILKRILKLLGIILLMFLAPFGMAIGGAVPFSPIRKPDNRTETKIELVIESKKEESEFDDFEIRQ
jgi:hypothetical protein